MLSLTAISKTLRVYIEYLLVEKLPVKTLRVWFSAIRLHLDGVKEGLKSKTTFRRFLWCPHRDSNPDGLRDVR
jgi:hypothetical protein